MTKMLKRILALTLAVLMVLSMTACGGSEASTNDTKASAEVQDKTPVASGEKQKIIVWNNNTNENQLKELEAQLNEIAEDLNFEFEMVASLVYISMKCIPSSQRLLMPAKLPIS